MDDTISIFRVLFVDAAVRTIIVIKDGDNISDVARKSGVTNSHTGFLIKRMEECGLLEIGSGDGRSSKIAVAHKGKKVRDLLQLIMESLKNGKKPKIISTGDNRGIRISK